MTTKLNLSEFQEKRERKKQILDQLWSEMLSQHPTENHWIAGLCQGNKNATCNRCGSSDYTAEFGDRIGICNSCQNQVWLTAGTLYHGIRRPLAWFGAIWLKDRAADFNGADLARLAEISPSSSGHILKSIGVVINSELEIEEESIEISSAEYEPIICKRSIETPANKHPFAEQEEMEKRSKLSGAGVNQSKGTEITATFLAPSVDLTDIQKRVYSQISTEPIAFKDLCDSSELSLESISAVLGLLEVYSLIERCPGDCYVLSTEITRPPKPVRQTNPSPAEAQSLEELVTAGCEVDKVLDMSKIPGLGFIKEGFQGVSRKYLQLYVAAFWCHNDRKRWPVGSIAEACSRYGPVSSKRLLAFVSPLMLKTMPC